METMLYAHLEEAIRSGHPDQVWYEISTVLFPLAEGRDCLDAIRHPLGFICLPIMRDESSEGVCLHYWSIKSMNDKPTTSRYHCHSWSLVSYVLAGSVGNQLLDLVPGDRFRLFRAESDPASNVDNLVPTDRLTDVRLARTEIYRAGESYEVAAGDFHASVRTATDVSVTITLGRVVPSSTDLTLGNVDQGPHQVKRNLIGAAGTRQLADRVLELRS